MKNYESYMSSTYRHYMYLLCSVYMQGQQAQSGSRFDGQTRTLVCEPSVPRSAWNEYPSLRTFVPKSAIKSSLAYPGLRNCVPWSAREWCQVLDCYAFQTD